MSFVGLHPFAHLAALSWWPRHGILEFASRPLPPPPPSPTGPPRPSAGEPPGTSPALDRTGPEPADAARHEAERQAQGDHAGPDAGPILMVDDEPAVLRLMRGFLIRAGFEVATAASGEEALALVRGTPRRFSAVVLDLTMPGMGGDATLAALRTIDPEVPVILASGYSEAEVARRCAGLEFSSFLAKPYLPADLVAEIRRVIMVGPPRRDGNPGRE
jgi:CheY-like chemotaxis protein